MPQGQELIFVYKTETGKNTLPESGSPFRSTITGTVDQGAGETRVTGTSTLFTQELRAGGYLYSDDLNEIRKIESIIDDTNLILKVAFGSALVAKSLDTFDVPSIREASLLNIGPGNAVLQGQVWPPNVKVNVTIDGDKPVQPIDFDGAGNTIVYFYTY